MKLIDSSVEIISQKPGLQGIYEQIELAARTAYKSLDLRQYDENGNSTTAKKMVDFLVDKKHGSCLEHGTVYLKMPTSEDFGYWYIDNKYSFVNVIDGYIYVTTNYRVLVENNRLGDLNYICEPTDMHVKRITAKFICDRGVSHEFVRHRVFSFLMESQRYCNYTKDKFEEQITYIKPYWYDSANNEAKNLFGYTLSIAQSAYLLLVDKYKLKPEQARAVLPNATKTELIMTGTERQWEEFFKLRCDKAAHPDAQKLAIELEGLIWKQKETQI